ncbi:hypothetical protein FACS1894204_09150 [Synergistales bacterium]|nr:hypothetical protein FACS1894204_09150 [Synergistales bacterium]
MCTVMMTALSAASSIAQGMAAQSSAKAQAAVAEQNARLAEEQADDAVKRGGREENKFRRQISIHQGQQRALLAAAGVDIDSGSAALLQDASRNEAEEDASVIRFNAAREAWGHQVQAVDYQNAAAGARAAGRNAFTGGVIGAGASLLSLAGDGGWLGKTKTTPVVKGAGETLWGGYDKSELEFLRNLKKNNPIRGFNGKQKYGYPSPY